MVTRETVGEVAEEALVGAKPVTEKTRGRRTAREKEDPWQKFFTTDGSPIAVRGGKLYLEVSELLVNVKVSRGEYNRNQVYGHLKVAPAFPWLVEVPVGEEQGLNALRIALESMHDVVTEVVQRKASELDSLDKEELKRATAKGLSSRDGCQSHSSVEVTTPVRTIESGSPGTRPSMDAAVGMEPSDDEEDF